MKKLIPVMFLFACACKKSDTIPAMQMSDMPLKGGNSWSYAVTNYPATQTDTAVYQIANAMSVFGATVTYYTTTTIKGVVVDSGTINSGSPSITYVGDNGVQTFAGSGLFDEWVLTFPITAQSSWSAAGGTIKVIAGYPNITLGGNNYKNVYTLLRSVITPGGMVNDTLYIAPQIGIVQWNRFPLVSYHLQ
jgi:hypothetical protein